MGLLTFFPPSTDTHSQPHKPNPSSSSSSSTTSATSKTRRRSSNNNKQNKNHQPSSWNQFKNLLSCKQTQHPHVHDPSKKPAPFQTRSGYYPGRSSCASICSFRDVVHGNARVVHRADNSPENSSLGQDTRLLTRKPGHGSSSRSLASSVRSSGTASFSTTSSRGIQLKKLSGCYECHMIVDPSRYPITPRATVCACSQCGDIFPKIESLELHQSIRHAVSELGPEDSGRNIVEIIFKSSWMKKVNPVCKIERILKVQNTQRTLQRFEECRDAVKTRAKKNPRCAADGNELLRFQCTTLSCALGANASSSLCGSVPGCGVCTIIRHGFQGNKGVKTTASSGRAHDSLDCSDHVGRRAMLVCRVIAGRIRRTPEDEPSSTADGTCYDSVAGPTAGVYSNLEDLVVFNPKAILPCFVVIYNTLNVN